jgi:hypothetical protein
LSRDRGDHAKESRLADSLPSLDTQGDKLTFTGVPNTGPAASLDAVVISHFSIDHIAPLVLRIIPKTTPVFASSLAYSPIVKLKHFDTVIEFGTYDPTNWKASQVEHLPPWLSLGLLNPVADIAHQTPAIIIAFEHEKVVNAVIYALHGIHPKEIAPVIESGEVEVLGLMCGLTATKTITGHLITHGGPQALACVRALKPRWWIKNHDDEHVNVYGLIGKALRMDEYTLDRVLKEEAGDGDGEVRGLEGTEFVDLRQGESMAMVA